jgi:hypothetical protein
LKNKYATLRMPTVNEQKIPLFGAKVAVSVKAIVERRRSTRLGMHPTFFSGAALDVGAMSGGPD